MIDYSFQKMESIVGNDIPSIRCLFVTSTNRYIIKSKQLLDLLRLWLARELNTSDSGLNLDNLKVSQKQDLRTATFKIPRNNA